MIVFALAIFIATFLMSELDINIKISGAAVTGVMWLIVGGIAIIIGAVVGILIVAKERLA